MSTFRRGKSKVFYESEVWDPGEEARTSFRSSCYDEDEVEDSFVSSLLRPKGSYVDDYDYDDDELEVPDYRTCFSALPVLAPEH